MDITTGSSTDKKKQNNNNGNTTSKNIKSTTTNSTTNLTEITPPKNKKTKKKNPNSEKGTPEAATETDGGEKKEAEGGEKKGGEKGGEKGIETLEFFSGNPSVEVTNGAIHLYRDSKFSVPENVFTLPEQRSTVVCVLAVPADMTIAEFVHFTGPCQKAITNIRVIRDSSPNKYMVIIQFVDQAASDEFYLAFSGRRFNSLEPETCHVLFVASVDYRSPSEPFFPLSPSSHTELPTCPVCLERLDSSVSGVLTTLCNHSFHCSCLSKWKSDASCPVCRYAQLPVGMTSSCHECETTNSLWICIICGHVGCGRYVNFHAEHHYRETMHTYALELETQRVWDYAGDGYVHRIIQNKADGKLVEFPGVNNNSNFRGGVEEEKEKFSTVKIEAITMEYNFLLTSQLETQRAYFEKQLSKIEQEKEAIDKARVRAEQKATAAREKADKVFKELEFLKDINKSLVSNQEDWKNKVDAQLKDDTKDKKIAELEEQLRDMMFFIEAQKAVQGNGGELQDGSVVVVPTPPTASSSSTGKRSAKGKGKGKR